MDMLFVIAGEFWQCHLIAWNENTQQEDVLKMTETEGGS